MPKSASMYIRLDPQVKAEAEAIYSRYGMTLTEAVNVFLHQSLNVGGLPFDLRPPQPNAVTLAAMEEAEDIIRQGRGRYSNADDLLKDLKS